MPVAPRIVNDVSCVTGTCVSFYVAVALFGDVGG